MVKLDLWSYGVNNSQLLHPAKARGGLYKTTLTLGTLHLLAWNSFDWSEAKTFYVNMLI